MACVTDPRGNHLISALPHADWLRWRPWLEWTDLPLGKVLYESGAAMDYAYFPVTAIVSLLYVTELGASAELAVVGKEGLVGISLFMGGGSTPSRGVVQSAGEGFRMNAASFREHFDCRPPVQLLLLRYTQALIAQMSRTALCNRYHSVDQQVCRRLLSSMDRVAGNELLMTHELVANMLGVRREGVTAAALRLQRAGCIRYSRGCIDVLDRPALERRACECYAVVKRECDRLLPRTLAVDAAPASRVEPLRGRFVANGTAALAPGFAQAGRQAGHGPEARAMAALA